MDDLRLREGIQPLVRAINSEAALSTQRRVRESFDDDDSLRPELINDALPLQRIDVVVPSSEPAAIQNARFFLPEPIVIVRLAQASSASVTSTFEVDILVDGVTRASGAIRVGTSTANGIVSINVNSGSVIAIKTNTIATSSVTVSLFYKQERI